MRRKKKPASDSDSIKETGSKKLCTDPIQAISLMDNPALHNIPKSDAIQQSIPQSAETQQSMKPEQTCQLQKLNTDQSSLSFLIQTRQQMETQLMETHDKVILQGTEAANSIVIQETDTGDLVVPQETQAINVVDMQMTKTDGTVVSQETKSTDPPFQHESEPVNKVVLQETQTGDILLQVVGKGDIFQLISSEQDEPGNKSDNFILCLQKTSQESDIYQQATSLDSNLRYTNKKSLAEDLTDYDCDKNNSSNENYGGLDQLVTKTSVITSNILQGDCMQIEIKESLLQQNISELSGDTCKIQGQNSLLLETYQLQQKDTPLQSNISDVQVNALPPKQEEFELQKDASQLQLQKFSQHKDTSQLELEDSQFQAVNPPVKVTLFNSQSEDLHVQGNALKTEKQGSMLQETTSQSSALEESDLKLQSKTSPQKSQDSQLQINLIQLQAMDSLLERNKSQLYSQEAELAKQAKTSQSANERATNSCPQSFHCEGNVQLLAQESDVTHLSSHLDAYDTKFDEKPTMLARSPQLLPGLVCHQFNLASTLLQLPAQLITQYSQSEMADGGLDLPESQLLGALDESLSEPEQAIENTKFADLAAVTPHKRRNTNPSTSLTPNTKCVILPENSLRRVEDEKEEDGSSIVQGLILELSNLNRLIMTTHRDLRQRKVKLLPGKGTPSGGKRRREM